MASTLELRPSRLIGERYELQAFLGRGGNAEVWQARDRSKGEIVALKLQARDKGGVRLLRAERAHRAAVKHPNVVRSLRTHDFSREGYVATVMECLSGTTLTDYLRERHELSVQEAADLFLPVLEALRLIHRHGLVHRDLKPGNFMVVPRGELPERCVLIDFGIAKGPSSDPDFAEALTDEGPLGTPGYSAPEQSDRPATIGRAADVFALCATIYECLAGVPAFERERRPTWTDYRASVSKGPTPPRRSIPEDVYRVLLRGMSEQPEARPSLSELAEVLRRHATPGYFLEARSTPENNTDTVTAPERARRPQRRAMTRWAAAAVGGTLVVAALLKVSYRGPVAVRPATAPTDLLAHLGSIAPSTGHEAPPVAPSDDTLRGADAASALGPAAVPVIVADKRTGRAQIMPPPGGEPHLPPQPQPEDGGVPEAPREAASSPAMLPAAPEPTSPIGASAAAPLLSGEPTHGRLAPIPTPEQILRNLCEERGGVDCGAPGR